MPAKAWKVHGVACPVLETGDAATFAPIAPLLDAHAGTLDALEYALVVRPDSGEILLAVRPQGMRAAGVSIAMPDWHRHQTQLPPLAAAHRGLGR